MPRRQRCLGELNPELLQLIHYDLLCRKGETSVVITINVNVLHLAVRGVLHGVQGASQRVLTQPRELWTVFRRNVVVKSRYEIGFRIDNEKTLL